MLALRTTGIDCYKCLQCHDQVHSFSGESPLGVQHEEILDEGPGKCVGGWRPRKDGVQSHGVNTIMCVHSLVYFGRMLPFGNRTLLCFSLSGLAVRKRENN